MIVKTNHKNNCNENTIKISNSIDLTNLLLNIGPFKFNSNKIEIALDIHPEESRKQLEKRINENYNACGCRSGEVFVLLGIAGIFLLIVLKPLGTISLNLNFFLISIGSIFFLALIGKLTGLLIAHLNLKRDLIRLQNQIGGN